VNDLGFGRDSRPPPTWPFPAPTVLVAPTREELLLVLQLQAAGLMKKL